MLIGHVIHPLSILLQLAAVVWALGVIPCVGREKAWQILSAAFVLMCVDGALELLEHYKLLSDMAVFDALHDLNTLGFTVLLVVGVFKAHRIFEEHGQAQQKLQHQLDELRRFQQLTVGRELRMKTLVEENAALRDRVAAAQPEEMES